MTLVSDELVQQVAAANVIGEISPPHSTTPLRVLTVFGAPGAKAILPAMRLTKLAGEVFRGCGLSTVVGVEGRARGDG